jgi:hypothetical protein
VFDFPSRMKDIFRALHSPDPFVPKTACIVTGPCIFEPVPVKNFCHHPTFDRDGVSWRPGVDLGESKAQRLTATIDWPYKVHGECKTCLLFVDVATKMGIQNKEEFSVDGVKFLLPKKEEVLRTKPEFGSPILEQLGYFDPTLLVEWEHHFPSVLPLVTVKLVLSYLSVEYEYCKGNIVYFVRPFSRLKV